MLATKSSINGTLFRSVLGLGLINSTIEATLEDAWGANTTMGSTVFSNIISQNDSLNPFYDMVLGRTEGLDGFTRGSLVIGTHAPGIPDAVEQSSILSLVDLDRWTITLEGMSVNGQNYTLGAPVSNATWPGTLVSFMDVATTVNLLPPDMVDFIYSNIPGSIKLPTGVWLSPCLSSANVSFIFGYAIHTSFIIICLFSGLHAHISGQEYPIHPLDLTAISPDAFVLGATNATFNYTTCFPNFISMGEEETEELEGEIDLVLGGNFLKNVYAS